MDVHLYALSTCPYCRMTKKLPRRARGRVRTRPRSTCSRATRRQTHHRRGQSASPAARRSRCSWPGRGRRRLQQDPHRRRARALGAADESSRAAPRLPRGDDQRRPQGLHGAVRRASRLQVQQRDRLRRRGARKRTRDPRARRRRLLSMSHPDRRPRKRTSRSSARASRSTATSSPRCPSAGAGCSCCRTSRTAPSSSASSRSRSRARRSRCRSRRSRTCRAAALRHVKVGKADIAIVRVGRRGLRALQRLPACVRTARRGVRRRLLRDVPVARLALRRARRHDRPPQRRRAHLPTCPCETARSSSPIDVRACSVGRA